MCARNLTGRRGDPIRGSRRRPFSFHGKKGALFRKLLGNAVKLGNNTRYDGLMTDCPAESTVDTQAYNWEFEFGSRRVAEGRIALRGEFHRGSFARSILTTIRKFARR